MKMQTQHFTSCIIVIFFFFNKNQAAGIAKGAASVLKESAKNLGAVKVEEIAREIYTASSNTLEASKETTADYTAQRKEYPL